MFAACYHAVDSIIFNITEGSTEIPRRRGMCALCVLKSKHRAIGMQSATYFSRPYASLPRLASERQRAHPAQPLVRHCHRARNVGIFQIHGQKGVQPCTQSPLM
eukprot:4628621-Pyramimonas_sp.AAC.2